ncbi:CCHC-type domain-containing protein [Plasmodiophora brassicae]
MRRAQRMAHLDGATRQTATAQHATLTIPKKRREKEQPLPAEERALKKPKHGKEDGIVPTCWFCKGEHRLSQCPKATDDQKEHVVKKLRVAREARKEARLSSSSNANVLLLVV